MINNNTCMISKEVVVPAQVGTYSEILSFPYEIGLLRAKWFNKVSFGGDLVKVEIAPNSIIGVLAANAVTGSNELLCSPTVMANINIGYCINIGGQDLGAVIEILAGEAKIKTENNLSADLYAGAYVFQTIKVVPCLYLDAVDSMMVLEGDDDYLILPKNTPLVISYTNNNGFEKTYSVKLEYKY